MTFVKGMTLPHWSQTSLQLFMACPKAWLLTYSNQHPKQGPMRRNTSHPNLHLARIRAGRTVMIERFEALYNGEKWTAKKALSRLQSHLEESLSQARRRVPKEHIEAALENTLHQLEAMKGTKALRRVFDQRAPRWAYFPRSQDMLIRGVRVYSAPDLMVHHQHKWTLVRIRFGPRPEPHHAEAEARLMVHWAMAHQALPSHQEAYRIRTLSWSNNGWEEHRITVNQPLMAESWALMSSDLQAMKQTQRLLRDRGDYGAVPLATSASACAACRWKPSCLGERTLASAKRDQIEGLLSQHQSEPTRSANTASTS